MRIMCTLNFIFASFQIVFVHGKLFYGKLWKLIVCIMLNEELAHVGLKLLHSIHLKLINEILSSPPLAPFYDGVSVRIFEGE